MRQCFTRTCIDVADAQRFARVAGLCPGARRESAVHALAERYVDDQSVLDASWLSQVISATRAVGCHDGAAKHFRRPWIRMREAVLREADRRVEAHGGDAAV
jgi:hypothetical protein